MYLHIFNYLTSAIDFLECMLNQQQQKLTKLKQKLFSFIQILVSIPVLGWDRGVLD